MSTIIVHPYPANLSEKAPSRLHIATILSLWCSRWANNWLSILIVSDDTERRAGCATFAKTY